MESTPLPILRAKEITKRFGLRTIFRNVELHAYAGEKIALTGENGSGKSTLLKILAGLTEASKGTIERTIDAAAVSDHVLPRKIGLVAPYLTLYGEFTAWEHVTLVQQLRGLAFNGDQAREMFTLLGLEQRIHDPLRTYSSGMLQRMKYICALIHKPAFLFLDEPMSNLDPQGIAAVQSFISDSSARVTIIATNDANDIELCDSQLSIHSWK